MIKRILSVLFFSSLFTVFAGEPVPPVKQETEMKLPEKADDAFSQAMVLLNKCEDVGDDDLEKNAEFRQALTLLRHASRLGNADAMFALAYLLADGIGVKKDISAALALLDSAAKNGHGGALMSLGAYWSDPAHKDDAKAVEYFRLALEKNMPGAGLRFGAMCYAGRGIKRDTERAAAAFSADALKGDPMAQNLLGVMQFSGEGLERDVAGAIGWFSKAAEQDFAPAINNLGVIARLNNSKDGIDEAFRLFSKAAEKGYAPAQRNLAHMYMDGAGTAVDYKKARSLAEAAAAQGDASAYHTLGMMEMMAVGTEKNPEKAAVYYRMAAEKGYAPACLQLADMYRNGIGVAKDEKAADLWLKKASEPKALPQENLSTDGASKPK